MPAAITFDDIVDTFRFLGDWEARYEFLVELGESLPPLDPAHRLDDNRVHGCMSKVWITAERNAESPATVDFLGDCDTATIRGLVAVLIALYSGHTPQRVREIDADQVFEKLGLYDHLSPHRHVGVYAIVEKIKEVSRRFDAAPRAETLRQPGHAVI